jgi:hypothetical protein
MTQPRGTAKEALREYLSMQPDRTATLHDIQRAVEGLLGRKVHRSTLLYAKAELGITHRTGGMKGKPGQQFVSWWTLPGGQSISVQPGDQAQAERLIAAYGNGEYSRLLDESRPRIDQVITALVQLAREWRAEAES